MSHSRKDSFTSHIGFFLSMIGVAIGAGNIWRFSRVVAQNGGGTFLIPWVIFLFIWSIPLIIAELGLGKHTKCAPTAMMTKIIGPKAAWMGALITFINTAILFYYSVVVGWGARYFFYSLTGVTASDVNHSLLWSDFIHSYQPLVFHAAVLLVGCYIIYKGVAHGIEKTNKILIPLLLALIFMILIRALTLPGAYKGLYYLFVPQIKDLADYKIWIEALTQNAWDTGAGWGFFIVYAGFAHRNESITNNAALAAICNNLVSIIMAIIIFSTAFALQQQDGIAAMISGEASTNIGLTFIYLPKLFYSLPGTDFTRNALAALFFLAFTAGALSSLIAMIQVAVQTLQEFGIEKNRSIAVIGVLSFLLGAPSALSLAFFENQDWVWSLGLILNGAFVAYAVIRFGPNRFRRKLVNTVSTDIKMSSGYNFVISFLIPLQALILIGWYFTQTYFAMRHDGWWDPFKMYSLGTILFQWGLAFIFFRLCNRWMAEKVALHAREGHNLTED
jgi:neurotransmitter:Na+ symporter, NSS family